MDINIAECEFRGNSRGVVTPLINDSNKIVIKKSKTYDCAVLVDVLDADEIRSRVYDELLSMDKASQEYIALREIIEDKDDSSSFKVKAKNHIANFINGVLAGIVAGMVHSHSS